jgi:plasmid stabilization system protein ParE
MKIIWSDFASKMLREVVVYYKENVNPAIAKKIRNDIFKATIQLEKYPQMGQVELNLIRQNEEHRYLVEGNYKIIYKQVKEGILITDIFDTRQDPQKINVITRKATK